MLITKPIKHKMPHVTHHFEATYVSGLSYSTQTFNIILLYTIGLAHKMKMAITYVAHVTCIRIGIFGMHGRKREQGHIHKRRRK